MSKVVLDDRELRDIERKERTRQRLERGEDDVEDEDFEEGKEGDLSTGINDVKKEFMVGLNGPSVRNGHLYKYQN